MKTGDWSGNNKSVFSTLGASSHANDDREQNDFYATDPKAVDILIKESPVEFKRNVLILEPAVGLGHLSKRLEELGYTVSKSDLINRDGSTIECDFLKLDAVDFDSDERDINIITNPPYKFAKEFVEKSLEIVNDGNLVAMFLKLQFLEGKGRKKLFLENPPKYVLVSSSRLLCAKNGIFDPKESSAVAYGWFIWEKGFKGNTELRWVN